MRSGAQKVTVLAREQPKSSPALTSSRRPAVDIFECDVSAAQGDDDILTRPDRGPASDERGDKARCCRFRQIDRCRNAEYTRRVSDGEPVVAAGGRNNATFSFLVAELHQCIECAAHLERMRGLQRVELEVHICAELTAEMIRAYQRANCEMCSNARGRGLDILFRYQHGKKYGRRYLRRP